MALHIDTTCSLELYKLLKVGAGDIQSRKRLSPQAKFLYIQKHLSRNPGAVSFLPLPLFFLRESVVWVFISYINKLMYMFRATSGGFSCDPLPGTQGSGKRHCNPASIPASQHWGQHFQKSLSLLMSSFHFLELPHYCNSCCLQLVSARYATWHQFVMPSHVSPHTKCYSLLWLAGSSFRQQVFLQFSSIKIWIIWGA